MSAARPEAVLTGGGISALPAGPTADDLALLGLGDPDSTGRLRFLRQYVELLTSAQERMNLIGRRTLADVWRRHIADSAQLLGLGREGGLWLDMGAGAGLPGMVLAILGARVAMIEATGKKAKFLAETAEVLGLGAKVVVHTARIEAMQPFAVDMITARAVASLPQLFVWGMPFATDTTRWILPKGAGAADEVAGAREKFDFDCELIASRTEPAARIIVARDVRARARFVAKRPRIVVKSTRIAAARPSSRLQAAPPADDAR